MLGCHCHSCRDRYTPQQLKSTKLNSNVFNTVHVLQEIHDKAFSIDSIYNYSVEPHKAWELLVYGVRVSVTDLELCENET